jgi:hypothetical protein
MTVAAAAIDFVAAAGYHWLCSSMLLMYHLGTALIANNCCELLCIT